MINQESMRVPDTANGIIVRDHNATNTSRKDQQHPQYRHDGRRKSGLLVKNYGGDAGGRGATAMHMMAPSRSKSQHESHCLLLKTTTTTTTTTSNNTGGSASIPKTTDTSTTSSTGSIIRAIILQSSRRSLLPVHHQHTTYKDNKPLQQSKNTRKHSSQEASPHDPPLQFDHAAQQQQHSSSGAREMIIAQPQPSLPYSLPFGQHSADSEAIVIGSTGTINHHHDQSYYAQSDEHVSLPGAPPPMIMMMSRGSSSRRSMWAQQERLHQGQEQQQPQSSSVQSSPAYHEYYHDYDTPTSTTPHESHQLSWSQSYYHCQHEPSASPRGVSGDRASSQHHRSLSPGQEDLHHEQTNDTYIRNHKLAARRQTVEDYFAKQQHNHPQQKDQTTLSVRRITQTRQHSTPPYHHQAQQRLASITARLRGNGESYDRKRPELERLGDHSSSSAICPDPLADIITIDANVRVDNNRGIYDDGRSRNSSSGHQTLQYHHDRDHDRVLATPTPTRAALNCSAPEPVLLLGSYVPCSPHDDDLYDCDDPDRHTGGRGRHDRDIMHPNVDYYEHQENHHSWYYPHQAPESNGSSSPTEVEVEGKLSILEADVDFQKFDLRRQQHLRNLKTIVNKHSSSNESTTVVCAEDQHNTAGAIKNKHTHKKSTTTTNKRLLRLKVKNYQQMVEEGPAISRHRDEETQMEGMDFSEDDDNDAVDEENYFQQPGENGRRSSSSPPRDSIKQKQQKQQRKQNKGPKKQIKLKQCTTFHAMLASTVILVTGSVLAILVVYLVTVSNKQAARTRADDSDFDNNKNDPASGGVMIQTDIPGGGGSGSDGGINILEELDLLSGDGNNGTGTNTISSNNPKTKTSINKKTIYFDPADVDKGTLPTKPPPEDLAFVQVQVNYHADADPPPEG
jgi:hypothetical protein